MPKELPTSISELNARCHLVWKRYLERAYVPFKIKLKQYYILKILQKRDASPAEVCNILFCDKPTASVIIANLIRYGWVEKITHPQDKRRYTLRLCPAGLAKLEEIQTKVKIPCQFNSGLSMEEQEQLKTLLQKQLSYLEKVC